jgi:D-3-phosphoglycerate dehydrogenase
MNTRKILIILPKFVEGIYLNLIVSILKKQGYEILINLYTNVFDESQLILYLTDVDGYIAGLEKITSKVINSTKKLKIISEFGVGIDNIDLEAATNKKIVVCNTKGVNSYAVAEMTITLMLNLARDITNFNTLSKNGKWSRKITSELRGKTLGIVGVGQIGKEVLKLAKMFQMKIIGYDIIEDRELLENKLIEYCSFKEILRNSDFVSVHLALTDTTKKIFSTEEFKIMKPTAFFLNLSRGVIVDEDALYEALKNKIIAGAALDVLSREAPGKNCLFHLENIIITPHVAALTHETMMETARMAAENITEFFKTGKCSRAVNIN